MEKMEVEEPKDDEDELAALMTASTTVRKRKLEVGPTINPKRRKQLKDLAMFDSSDDACQREREQNFAVSYYNKLKEQLDEAKFSKVIKLLANFDGSSEGVIDLFKDMSSVLPASLAEDFLCFLTPAQAHLCGKFMDHLVLSKMIDFFRKFEISFAKQPQMLRKFYDILCQLSSSENISLQQVRDAVLPLLKSKGFLMEYFLQLFPAEKPSDSIVLDDFEDIYLDGDCGSEEEIRLADTDDSANCACSCHVADSTQHCQRCSVKYINGRVYIQTGKILRTARVEFNGFNPVEALRRVCVNNEELTPKAKPSRRKPDILSHKDLSPIKHASSPHMTATESEDESLEVRANTLTPKPKSARSLKLKFKSSDKLPMKIKNSKISEVSEEMRIITDENAITDTPDCFLARRLSPVEGVDNTVVGNNTNFNNILSDNQNDLSRPVNPESTLNFAVHSPLKKASICLDSLDSTSESIQSPIKIDQCLHIPLKRIDDDDLLLTMSNKKVSSSNSHNPLSEPENSFSVKCKTENFQPETSMNLSMSGNIDSIFSNSVVDEMNLLLGSSSAVKSDDSELIKSTQNGGEKFSEPTIDSLSIDSFLNISNLDAKIDSFLTNTEGAKNLDALLNDSSPECSNIDKSIYLNGNKVKEEVNSQLLTSIKLQECHEASNSSSEENRSEASSTIDKPALKVENNMDSILNIESQDIPQQEDSSKILNNDIILTDSLNGALDKTEEQDLKPCMKTENDSKRKEEIQGDVQNSEVVSTVQIVCNGPKFKTEEIEGIVNNSILISECPTQIVDTSKVDFSAKDQVDSLQELAVPALMVSQENVTMIDAIQSVSFICGEDDGESGKVTLFSAEPIEEKSLHNDDVVSIPEKITPEEFCVEKQFETSFSDSSEKISTECISPISPLKDSQASENSSSNLLKDEQESNKLELSNSSCSPSNEILESGGSNSVNPLKDSGKNEETTFSSCAASPLKDESINEKSISAEPSLVSSKIIQNAEASIRSDTSSLSKETHDETESSAQPESTKMSEESILSENQSQLSTEDPDQENQTGDLSEDSGSKPKDQGNDWTMEEDKIILQTFQKDPDMQDIFSKIKTQLPGRSLLEVQSRFYVLIELLEKMSDTSDGASKKE